MKTLLLPLLLTTTSCADYICRDHNVDYYIRGQVCTMKQNEKTYTFICPEATIWAPKDKCEMVK